MISVVVPSMGGPLLDRCIDSLQHQKIRHEAIVVVPKGTVCQRPGVRVVEESAGTRAGACNAGAAAARGSVIVFTDDDCTFPADWLSRIQEAFKKRIDVFGGGDIQQGGTYFQKALYQMDLAKELKMRTEDASFHSERRLRGCNTAYRVFPKEQFNPALKGIEDTEFHHRLAKKGYRMIYDPDLVVYHDRRNGFMPLARRLYSNGISRMQLVKMNRYFLLPMDIAAASGVMATVAALLLYFYSPFITAFFLSLLAVYFVVKALSIVERTKNMVYFPMMVPIIAVREFAFGMGVLRGLLMRF